MLIMVCLYDPILLQMSKKIEELENSALAEKPWQLSGEVTAQARPENSLLEEDVEFEQMSRTGMFPDSILVWWGHLSVALNKNWHECILF